MPTHGRDEGLSVVGDGKSGLLIIETSAYRYAFRTKDNVLVEATTRRSPTNLVATVKGAGGHWIYVTGRGTRAHPKKLHRQGEVRGEASHRIREVTGDRALIEFRSVVHDLEIVEEFAFSADSPVVRREYRVRALNEIPDLTLLSWQVKLGKSGAEQIPYDTFLWGSGARCIVRNEQRLATVDEIDDPSVAVAAESAWTATYWLDPGQMREQFIATLSTTTEETWILAFPERDRVPWYFFGDRGRKANYSTWLGFRVFGDNVYSRAMPVSCVEKGRSWSNTCWQILAPAKNRREVVAGYREAVGD